MFSFFSLALSLLLLFSRSHIRPHFICVNTQNVSRIGQYLRLVSHLVSTKFSVEDFSFLVLFRFFSPNEGRKRKRIKMYNKSSDGFLSKNDVSEVPDELDSNWTRMPVIQISKIHLCIYIKYINRVAHNNCRIYFWFKNVKFLSELTPVFSCL